MPFFSTLPKLNEPARRAILSSISAASRFNSARSANCTSSSLKSSSNSINATNSSSFPRKAANSPEKLPRIWFNAIRCAAADVEAMRSATASACDRSILPLRKARCENSPGVASAHPCSNNNFNTCCWMNREPWQEISHRIFAGIGSAGRGRPSPPPRRAPRRRVAPAYRTAPCRPVA